MISMLSGRIHEISGKSIVLDVNGVGYEVICTAGCLNRAALGETLSITTHTDVKEDSIRLYGFEDALEKRVFSLLIRVKGLGAKSASDLLSKIDKRELLRVIGASDLDRLLKIKGVGRKTAERMLVELKDKVVEHAAEMQLSTQIEKEVSGGAFREAIEALQALGFARREAEMAVEHAEAQLQSAATAEPSEIIKEALKFV